MHYSPTIMIMAHDVSACVGVCSLWQQLMAPLLVVEWGPHSSPVGPAGEFDH